MQTNAGTARSRGRLSVDCRPHLPKKIPQDRSGPGAHGESACLAQSSVTRHPAFFLPPATRNSPFSGGVKRQIQTVETAAQHAQRNRQRRHRTLGGVCTPSLPEFGKAPRPGRLHEHRRTGAVLPAAVFQSPFNRHVTNILFQWHAGRNRARKRAGLMHGNPDASYRGDAGKPRTPHGSALGCNGMAPMAYARKASSDFARRPITTFCQPVRILWHGGCPLSGARPPNGPDVSAAAPAFREWPAVWYFTLKKCKFQVDSQERSGTSVCLCWPQLHPLPDPQSTTSAGRDNLVAWTERHN